MCGRAFRKQDFADQVKESLGSSISQYFTEAAKEKIEPGENITVLTGMNPGSPVTHTMTWGFKLEDKLVYNAREDKLNSSRYWLSNGPCRGLLLVSGFYEKNYKFDTWDHKVMMLAAVHNEKRFAIVTIPAVMPVSQRHHRMPIPLSKEEANAWMAGQDVHKMHALPLVAL